MAATRNDDEDRTWVEVKEGRAAVLYPASESVFYNPVQQFNRDLSILAIKEFISIYCKEWEEKEKTKQSRHTKSSHNEMLQEQQSSQGMEATHRPKVRVMEGLAATGLRSIRYALEIDGIGEIVANDISKAAVENIERNVGHNKVDSIIKPSLNDAGLLMYQNKFPLSKRFQVIDLDPYGSPASFLDGAVQAVDDGGLLCITCTDMAGLCGNHGEASFAKYGAMPLKSKCCHEMALRIVLGSIEAHAGRYKRYMMPLLSVSADFYVRVFVRITTSASEVKRSASKKSYVFQCVGCDSFHLQPVGKRIEEGNKKKYNPGTGPVVGESCKECGQRFQIGGPIWSEPMHDKKFVESLLKRLSEENELYGTSQRMKGTLTVVSEELEDAPLYYVIDKLANVIHCCVPSMLQFRSALINLGYQVSSTHANSNGVKTDAPPSVIWDILRCWEKEHPVSEKTKTAQSPAAAILSKPPKIEASFVVVEEANPKSRKMKISRFPENPLPDWGPKARAKGSTKFQSLSEKRKQLQGKKTKRKELSSHPLTKDFPCKRHKQGLCEFSSEDCRYLHKEESTIMAGSPEKATTEE
ncbi:tRNA (guanine(26)-N(2))-dimethyltransferase-like [Rhopilema esculentum]|uniref:tRNA (guanine(26)-N(2))-dimethyltransferase-like n=1 Tax=Rhopilema esculentum TaxID=499914 RepID=UPI0031DCB166